MRGRIATVDSRLVIVKLILAAAAVVVSGAVLWFHQSTDALLGGSSFWEALGVTLFAATPGLLLYVALAHGRVASVIEGLIIRGIMGAQWWYSATDHHSTAGIGPFLIGWLLIPTIVFLTLVGQNWNTDFVSTPAKIALLIPATLLLVLLGPVGWVIAAVVWWLTMRRRTSGVDPS
jgi:hypothetical protein